jgi:hypothetical protein
MSNISFHGRDFPSLAKTPFLFPSLKKRGRGDFQSDVLFRYGLFGSRD